MTTFELIQKLSRYPSRTELLIAPYGATDINDMKFIFEVSEITAEGQTWATIKIGEE